MRPPSVAPARRLDTDPSSQPKLELVPYIESLAPERWLPSNPHSLIRERPGVDSLTVAAFSATAGYVDAVGFLTLFGLFPAHVTGELVGLTTALSAGHEMTHPSRYAVIPIFVVALIGAALVTRSRRRLGKSPLAALLLLMALTLSVCAASGVLGFWAGTEKLGWVLGLREGSMVAAMAFQNAFTRAGLTSSCPTTVMTGNLTHVVYDLVESACARFGRSVTEETHARTLSSRFPLVAGALGAFLGGALLGGYLTSLVGAFSVLVPALLALHLARRFATPL